MNPYIHPPFRLLLPRHFHTPISPPTSFSSPPLPVGMLRRGDMWGLGVFVCVRACARVRARAIVALCQLVPLSNCSTSTTLCPPSPSPWSPRVMRWWQVDVLRPLPFHLSLSLSPATPRRCSDSPCQLPSARKCACVCVSVCVCVWERERERESVCVCVYACAYVWVYTTRTTSRRCAAVLYVYMMYVYMMYTYMIYVYIISWGCRL